MAVIINGNSYTSGVSNVEDDFIDLSNGACDAVDLSDYNNDYRLIDVFEVKASFLNGFATINFDVLELDKTQKILIKNVFVTLSNGDQTQVPFYSAISKDKINWIEDTEYEFNTISTDGNVFIQNESQLENAITLEATIEVYKLSDTQLEYTDCNGVAQILPVERQKAQRTLDYIDAPKGNATTPPASYSEIDTDVLVNPDSISCAGDIKVVPILKREITNYNNGFDFYVETTNAYQSYDVKIEGIDGYCEFELTNPNGYSNILQSQTPPQTGFEAFQWVASSSNWNQYWTLRPTTGGANCDPITTTPTKLTLIEKQYLPTGYTIPCCDCNSDKDFCATDSVELEFINNCGENVKLKIKGKIQGGRYQIQGESFKAYNGETVRPVTDIRAIYDLVIFQYSDSFFLALQDLLADNLTLKVNGIEYLFESQDITPTFDSYSEYGFASISLVKKNSIKRKRRNCC